jgi:heme/copper-type cytochrome/quinol oxidase subunit 3
MNAQAATAGRLAPSGVLGMLVFLATETMFFAGLISAFLILRAGAVVWPPEGQPRLPIAITGVNTLVLLASGAAMWAALAAARRDDVAGLGRALAATLALGVTFLVVQGSEWVRLLRHGLSATASPYGATFYALIGIHGLHVLGGVVALAFVLPGAARGRYRADHGSLAACGLYWGFVVAVWPLLYLLVYLA